MSTTTALVIETPSGIVRATAGPRSADAVVFELNGAMRGSVHVTGTNHPHYWDQFTAVRACLGPVDAFETTAPDEALPRLARGRTGFHGSLTRYPSDSDGRPGVSVYPLSTALGNDPSPKAAETLTAVLSACAESVAQRDDLPLILDASRLRKTPGLLRFLNWAGALADADSVRRVAESQAAHRALNAAVAGWWSALRLFTAQPHPVLLLVLADYKGSLARRILVLMWEVPYLLERAAEERGRAEKFWAEVTSLRAQQRRGRARRSVVHVCPEVKEWV
ncbi:hypothetical protein ACIOJ9_39675 [Streptomyces sp. NPDC088175]|uniref:hypothetical protein n=1 Tax=unclassified Streptomyces TaxID=2593676 RepID=UPI0038223B8A